MISLVEEANAAIAWDELFAIEWPGNVFRSEK